MSKPITSPVWTNDDLRKINKLRKDGKTAKEMAKFFPGKTWKSIARKCYRVDWEEFDKDPSQYETEVKTGKWSDEEIIQLDAYVKAGQNYEFIAKKLGRSLTAVERQHQETDWPSWRIYMKGQSGSVSGNKDEASEKYSQDQLVNALLNECRNDFKRVGDAKESKFLTRVNIDRSKMGITFPELKEKAKEKLIEFGQGNPESIELGTGRYVIIGDSHGKHTNKDMFDLLENVNKTLKPKKIIHIGHLLDDDNEISYDWGRFPNLIVLAKVEELKLVQSQRNGCKFKYDIVLNDILMGKDLYVLNQDLISDYVKTPLTTLDSEILDNRVIVNSHRLELTTRCSNEARSYFASPGCICEEHIPRTIKQISFQDGGTVKQAFPEGFIKYRRMRHMNGYWERGIIVVEVDKKGDHTLVPCQIKKTPRGWTTSYFDKIITSQGVFSPDKKIFVNGDMHCDKHDINVLDIQEQFCKDYKPDIQVNIGDTFNYSSLNHHVMDRGGVILDKKLLDEAAATTFVLKRVLGWAKESHLICGNHERFARDFVEKYPQFGEYLDFNFMCDLKNMGYILTPLKNVLKIGSAKFIHGEAKLFGQQGSKLEKVARTFSKNCFLGHIHRPEIRFGTFSIGLSGLLNQDYNESESSNWMHGFGTCNQFMGHSFLTTVAIDNYKCTIGNKTYCPINIDSWKMHQYKARLTYEF
jgi:hypothetical protein